MLHRKLCRRVRGALHRSRGTVRGFVSTWDWGGVRAVYTVYVDCTAERAACRAVFTNYNTKNWRGRVKELLRKIERTPPIRLR